MIRPQSESISKPSGQATRATTIPNELCGVCDQTVPVVISVACFGHEVTPRCCIPCYANVKVETQEWRQADRLVSMKPDAMMEITFEIRWAGRLHVWPVYRSWYSPKSWHDVRFLGYRALIWTMNRHMRGTPIAKYVSRMVTASERR